MLIVVKSSWQVKINHTRVYQQEPDLENWNHSRYFKGGNLMQGGGYTSVEGMKGQNETWGNTRTTAESITSWAESTKGKGRIARASSFEELELRLLRNECAQGLGAPWRKQQKTVLRLSKEPRGWTNCCFWNKVYCWGKDDGSSKKTGKKKSLFLRLPFSV